LIVREEYEIFGQEDMPRGFWLARDVRPAGVSIGLETAREEGFWVGQVLTDSVDCHRLHPLAEVMVACPAQDRSEGRDGLFLHSGPSSSAWLGICDIPF
jgi:hypothetical protein